MPANRDQIIFLDWDGTLCHSRFWQTEDLGTRLFDRIQLVLFSSNPALVKGWMLEKTTSEKVCEWLSGKIGVDYSIIWDKLVRSCERMDIPSEAVLLMNGLKQRARLVMVTDNMDCFSRFTVPALDLGNIFDLIVNCADIGRLKNDENGRTFINACERFSIPIDRACLIDNSRVTGALFSSLGGRFVFTGSLETTINHLRSLAIL